MKQKRVSYAGIGSRKTPSHILREMEQIGRDLARQGLVLRTGNCKGADQTFQQGANAIDPKLVELYLSWPDYQAESIALGNVVYTPSPMAYTLAARYHPAWRHCDQATRAMHARNVQIILGERLTEPVEYVICWTPKGKAVGGTAMGIRIAKAYGIVVKNLAGQEQSKRMDCQACFGW